MLSTTAPLTTNHLRQAITWAELATDTPLSPADGVDPRYYDQAEWGGH